MPDPPASSSHRERFESIAAELYEPLQRFLARRINREDAEEALDDVLLVIWRRLDDVPEEEIVPWSFGVARRVLANRHRAGRRRDRLIERLRGQVPTEVPDPAQQAEHADVVAALSSLGRRDREVLVLWAWEELEPREIAIVLDTTPNAVSIRLTRARQKLERSLRKDWARSGHVTGRGTGRDR